MWRHYSGDAIFWQEVNLLIGMCFNQLTLRINYKRGAAHLSCKEYTLFQFAEFLLAKRLMLRRFL